MENKHKNPILDSIIMTILSAIVSIVITSLVSLLQPTNGSILIGKPSTINNTITVPVIITNYSSKFIDKLKLFVPASVEMQYISSSSPVEISMSGNNTNKEILILSLSNIPPHTTTFINIPLNNSGESEQIASVNHTETHLTLLSNTVNEFPLWRNLKPALVPMIFYSIVAGLIVYLTSNSLEKSRQEFRTKMEKADLEFNKQAQDFEIKLRNNQQLLDKLEKQSRKVRFYLFARINDYKKELDFWRDTIRKTLYQSTGNDKSAETLISEITDTLKTYNTLRNDSSFEDTVWMAKVTLQSENKEE